MNSTACALTRAVLCFPIGQDDTWDASTSKPTGPRCHKPRALFFGGLAFALLYRRIAFYFL